MASAVAQLATQQPTTLDGLALRCAQETERFFGGQDHDTSYCFELFQRALGENDQQAWEMVYAQYRPLVAGWVANHPDLPWAGGEIGDFANRAFERMWAAWTPDKFARFSDLRALLAYLKMCVHSAVMEEVRRAGPGARAVSLSDLPEDVLDAQPGKVSTEGEVLRGERSRELWSLVSARLRDDRERVVVHGLFVLDLKPAAIRSQHPDMFRDTREVYLIRQVVLERLSRDAQLKKFLGHDA
jgi:DNA-directed RNA polymerase specialized sigma24 family protein